MISLYFLLLVGLNKSRASPFIASPAFLYSFNRQSHRLVLNTHDVSKHHHVLSLSDNDVNNCIGDAGYFIQRASVKARSLDAQVLRGDSISADEYVAEQQSVGNEISKTDAIDQLMRDYDDNGNYVHNLPPHYEPETYFVAVYNGTKPDIIEASTKQKGLIGVVSAQLRRRSPLIAGPSSTKDDSTTVLPSVPIPCPHLYLANMKVDETMRRKGVGMALLSHAREYAKEWSEKMNEEEVPLALSVDNDNTGAIRLYEKFGFHYLEMNDIFRVMILRS